jgi:hypothetical protein
MRKIFSFIFLFCFLPEISLAQRAHNSLVNPASSETYLRAQNFCERLDYQTVQSFYEQALDRALQDSMFDSQKPIFLSDQERVGLETVFGQSQLEAFVVPYGQQKTVNIETLEGSFQIINGSNYVWNSSVGDTCVGQFALKDYHALDSALGHQSRQSSGTLQDPLVNNVYRFVNPSRIISSEGSNRTVVFGSTGSMFPRLENSLSGAHLVQDTGYTFGLLSQGDDGERQFGLLMGASRSPTGNDFGAMLYRRRNF